MTAFYENPFIIAKPARQEKRKERESFRWSPSCAPSLLNAIPSSMFHWVVQHRHVCLYFSTSSSFSFLFFLFLGCFLFFFFFSFAPRSFAEMSSIAVCVCHHYIPIRFRGREERWGREGEERGGEGGGGRKQKPGSILVARFDLYVRAW